MPEGGIAWAGAIALATGSAPALAQSGDAGRSIVVTAPGGLGDIDEALTVDALRIRGAGRPDLFQALLRSVPGVTLQDAQNNPYQPNLVYRGFTISPLQGQAQGLAVYLDGARFNQPFGDTVQFDLLPETAIARLDLLDASPAYGLNALGGAMLVSTKTGVSAPGLFLSGSLGSHGEAEGVAEAGWNEGRASGYIALQESHDSGWRRFSPSALYNGYADFGWDGDRAGAHLKLIAADSDLTGNGSAPVELLRAHRRAVFTHPDNTRNRFGRISLHPWAALGDHTRIEASLYVQHLRQRTLNGDAADIEACDDDDEAGLLCLESAGEEEEAVLIGAGGDALSDVLGGEGYGVLNRSATRTRAGGILAQLVDRRSLAGGENMLVLGFSHDRSRTGFDSATELGALTNVRSVNGLGPIIAQPDGSIAPVSLFARTRYTGLFVSEKLPLTPDLVLEAGLRWNEARIRLKDRIGTALTGSHRFRRLNPGAEVNWRIGPGMTVRAGYAETSRAPTPAELSCAGEHAPCSLTNFFIADPPLEQVVARSFEAGGQGRFHHLEWLVTAYRTTTHHDIQFIASGTRGRGFFQNVGQTRRQGLEATLGYRDGGLTLRAGYAFTDATFRSPLQLTAPDNPQADEEGRIAVLAGDRIPGIARHRGLISVEYSADRWSLGADIQAASGQYLFGDEANLEPRTSPYVLTNLRGSVRLAGPLSLFAEVRNLLDTRYATFGTFSATDEIPLAEAPHAEDPRSLGPGAPRRVTIGLSARF